MNPSVLETPPRADASAAVAPASDAGAVTDIAIRAHDVSKCYRLYKRPQDRLKQALSFGRKKYFDEFWALKHVSFEVRRGQTVGIIGRNGSGKSTLLQIVCGTLGPTAGEVEVRGRVAALLELGSGFNPEFTGRENVFINAAILGVTREEIAARLGDIIAFADIGEHIDQPVKTYSSGMYVRLAFSVIAHIDAEVLVIDEALAVGDAFFNQKCMRYLRGFRERGTILFVSHDTSAVMNLCNAAVWLDHGQVRDAGPAKKICEDYLAAFFAAQQGPHRLKTHARVAENRRQNLPLVDQRLKYLNCSPFRNDLQIMTFDPQKAAFGKGGGSVSGAQLLDRDGQPLSWIVGGETVSLCVDCQIDQDMGSPIVGFLVKDRLGQTLFSDNTCISHAANPVPVSAGDTLEVRFTFQMPILPVGDYSIALSLAEGTQRDHVQHHWIHDAIVFKSCTSSACTGLVGIPMLDISMHKMGPHV